MAWHVAYQTINWWQQRKHVNITQQRNVRIGAAALLAAYRGKKPWR